MSAWARERTEDISARYTALVAQINSGNQLAAESALRRMGILLMQATSLYQAVMEDDEALEVAAQDGTVAALQPLVEFYENHLESGGTLTAAFARELPSGEDLLAQRALAQMEVTQW